MTPEEKKQRRREKMRGYVRAYRERNLEKERERQRQWAKNNRGKHYEWVKNNPEKWKNIRTKWLTNPENLVKQQEACKRWRQSPEGKAYMSKWHRERLSKPANRIRFMITGARYRASKSGMVFDSELYEIYGNKIPTHCACCGVELDYKMTKRHRYARGPSLDRVDSFGGYTVDNVNVVCIRCNMIKNDSSYEELKLLTEYTARELQKRNKLQPHQSSGPVTTERVLVRQGVRTRMKRGSVKHVEGPVEGTAKENEEVLTAARCKQLALDDA